MSTPRGPERPFLEALYDGVLVADGGMGTQLYERGILFSVNYEELNLSRPELVRRVHEDYVRAGAQLVETNTFGANAIRLVRHGFEDKVRAINTRAVELAREAANGKAYVAGAIGPTGLVFGGVENDPERVKRAFAEQASALVEAGVDLLLLETIRQPEELWLALDALRAVAGRSVPIVAAVSIDDELQMADGTGVLAIGEGLKARGVDVLGVNCSTGPQQVLAAAEQLVPLGVPVLAMPNAGLPRRVDERFLYVATPEYFGVYAQRLLQVGVKIIGGCCGTTPEHIRRIAGSARMAQGAAAPSAEPHGRDDDEYAHPLPPVGIELVPTHEKSAFASKVGRRFVVSVEVHTPVGLDPSRAIAAAKMLTDGGVDVVNIADGARAQARMSNVALAALMQRELGIETLVHVCGRDRNLLGQVAHLIGAHALGLRNLVVITGDPPKMGDFPDATAVYDLDSIGILRMASRLNRGVDPGGKPLGAATSFFLATGAEPAALNYEREIARLRQKVAAGAELVMTQPVYDPAVLERFLADTAPLGVPVLVGLLPLASHRNAEFLHNEVPGMQIPEPIRERMRKAGSGPSARKEGVAIAREMLSAVHERVAGAYVMPPLGRYELALEVVDGFAGGKGTAAPG